MAVEILMPALSPTMEEGTLARWLVQSGDRIAAGDVIAEIETDKATLEFEAAVHGTIGAILIAAGTAGIRVNTPIATLLADGETPDSATDARPVTRTPISVAKADPTPVRSGSATRVAASPVARRIAAERRLDLSLIAGSGPGGRIVRADVEAPVAPGARAVAPAPAPQSEMSISPAIAALPPEASAAAVKRLYADRTHTEVPLTSMRRTIAARLSKTKETVPHVYLRHDVLLDRLTALRAELNPQLAPRGLRLSVNDFIIKACARALQQVPAANAVWAGDSILRLTASDIAVAVAVDGGVFTPVVRDADSKSLGVISAETGDLAARARNRGLTPGEYQGGSLTISNLGAFGIESFDAILNPPQAAILAFGAALRKPIVAENGDIVAATVMSVTLGVDHRVIDGAVGAEFLRAVAHNLEHPLALLV
ncbi:dihydrolipoamide acetyltransferase family protein [Puniceibacterium confluentis]|uniref:dihydrolipoamide acetyltransferase family protein n=1 Tax=Puniceibacterium confluentis TaxID=1958944 RepID=UPI0011B6F1DD|nr:dihydrolipoamide acetyltransferase family protein [Puniceibacterium confluentis]